MYKFPKTDRGLRSRIAAYKKAMQQERRTFGCISDGYGKRYLTFWLYFVLGDLKEANTYIRWYERNFEDDVGEPIHKLCCALILHRIGKHEKAKYFLANLMLLNLYVIPLTISEKVDDYGIRFGSNYADLDYAEEIPSEILNAITSEEREWMRDLYNSLEFRRYRKRYIEIYSALENTHGVEKRSPLVREAGELLDELKQRCT
jgi:hypothetical protein